MSGLLKNAYREWIDESFLPGRTLAPTLNFRQRCKGANLTKEVAAETIRRFKHSLRRKVFGSRKASLLVDEYDLNFVAAYEGKASREDGIALHCHALVEVPAGLSTEDWRTLCEEQWTKLEWADPKNYRFNDYRSSGAVVYMLKNRTKEDWEQSIDFPTLRLAPQGATSGRR